MSSEVTGVLMIFHLTKKKVGWGFQVPLYPSVYALFLL